MQMFLNKKYMAAIAPVCAAIIAALVAFSYGHFQSNPAAPGMTTNESLNVSESSQATKQPGSTGRHLSVSINETVGVSASP